MVFGVCRRVLGNADDAADAFQATFMVLVRKVGCLDRQRSLGNWLYTVAHNLALDARTSAARRKAHERQAQAMRTTDSHGEKAANGALEWLDTELRRLPAKYRAPLVLCYLQGKTNEEAARELGCPPGSMSARLGRARDLLRERLAGQGVVLSAAGLAAVLGDVASATLPTELAKAVVRAALPFADGRALTGLVSVNAMELVDGALRHMTLAKWKILAALITLGMIGMIGMTGGLMIAGGMAEPREESAAASEVPAVAALSDKNGDPLPVGAVRRLGTTRLRHNGAIWQITFASGAGANVLASAGGDGTVALWEIPAGKLVRRIDAHQRLNGGCISCAVSADVKTVVTGGADGQNLGKGGQGKACIWDGLTGQLRHELTIAHGSTATRVALSADGKILATLGGMIHLWDAERGTMLRGVELPDEAQAKRIAVSSDGRLLIASGDNKEKAFLAVIDVATGKLLTKLSYARVGEQGVDCWAVSSDSKLLAVSLPSTKSEEVGTIALLDVATGRELQRLRDLPIPQGDTRAVAFAPDGATIAISGGGIPACIYDVKTGKYLRRCAGQGDFFSLAFSGDSRILAGANTGHAVHLWDVATGERQLALAGPTSAISHLVFGPDGQTLVSSPAAVTDGARLWDVRSGKELRHLSAGGGTRCVSPDACRLLAWAAHPSARGIDLGKNCLYDATSGRLVTVIENPWCNDSAAFSPDGRLLAVTMKDKQEAPAGIRFLDAATGEPTAIQPGVGVKDSKDQVAIGFSPDGSLLVTGAYLQPIGRMHTKEAQSFCLWQVATGKLVLRVSSAIRRDFGSHIQSCVAVSADAKWLAVGEQTFAWGTAVPAPDGYCITLWDVATGTKVARLGKADGVGSLAFSPDNRLLVWGAADGGIRFWEVASHQECLRRHGPKAKVTALAFALDGKTLASGSEDTTIMLWNVLADVTVRDPKVAPTAAALQAWWADLAGHDAVQAHRALAELARTPQQTVSFLKKHLRPEAIDPRRTAQLVADLENNQFSVRKMATDGLEEMGEDAVPALKEALTAKEPSLELQRRIEAILARLDDKTLRGERLRSARALELLEYLGDGEARDLVETLAGGKAEAWLTREARAVRERLARRAARSTRP